MLPWPAAAFALVLAPHRGRFRRLGVLRLGAPLDPAASDDLHFDPWNTGGRLEPTPHWLQRLRKPAYKGSQAGRDAD